MLKIKKALKKYRLEANKLKMIKKNWKNRKLFKMVINFNIY